ncbi:MAG: tRNA (N6-threonylcarbamoyladenosine(37)-N6)-methyltransferase TrmO [Lentisphaerae bacterium]|nr:tRNA (N6-threonylcarbamoyladenosine(37)-N6)-methyltransferase TrmO [Lentisphaerota bacterium]
MQTDSQTEPGVFAFSPVALVRSCFKSKFGIPRQPGLVAEARGSIVLQPPYNQPNAVRGLEGFSHIWVLFVFHESLRQGWKATVRPPRLGGETRVGVFASRSPFRPSPIGLSVLKLEKLNIAGQGRVSLEVSGLDLLDGTPVLDIKPYLPYTDAIAEAQGGFAKNAPKTNALQVKCSDMAAKQFDMLQKAGRQDLVRLCQKLIACDPRPAYQHEPQRQYSIFVEDYELVWQAGLENGQAEILELRKSTTRKPRRASDA